MVFERHHPVPIEDQGAVMFNTIDTNGKSRIVLATAGIAAIVTTFTLCGGSAATTSGQGATDRSDQAQSSARSLAGDGSSASSGLVTTSGTADFDTFLATLVEDNANYWSGQLAAWAPVYGTGEWQPLYYTILDSGESATSACTDEAGTPQVAGDPDELGEAANPAFFCGADMTVYLSSPWLYDHIWSASEDGTAADFGVAYAVAHEVGHAVQRDLDITEPEGSPTVAPTELQADCLAGVWSNAKYYQNVLEGNDIDEAVTTASAVGDYEFTNPGHHGTPEQRSAAFMVGYNSGDSGSCTLELADTL
jgi:predicted metalloprotease